MRIKPRHVEILKTMDNHPHDFMRHVSKLETSTQWEGFRRTIILLAREGLIAWQIPMLKTTIDNYYLTRLGRKVIENA